MVQVSLRTKDEREAKRLHATADAALRERWEIERRGPTPLSHRQVHALAGDWHRSIVAHHRENPGEPEAWDASIDHIADALEDADGRPGGESRLADVLRADEFLRARGLKLAPESYTAFLREAAWAHARRP